MERKLKLHFGLCPGDSLVGTVALESLHKTYPGKFLTDVSGTATDAIYWHNPNVTKLADSELINMQYPAIHQSSQRPIHFMQGYCEYLGHVLDLPLQPVVNRPMLYLSDEEKKWVNQVQEQTRFKGKYWLICSGVKKDYTVKAWGHQNYQAVVNHFKGKIQFVQVGEAHHDHKSLDNCINFIGKTDTRQLIRLAYNATGGIGGVSFLHHIFAAFQKPFVCIASGQESASWERYNTEVYLTRQGRISCGLTGGCWASRVVALPDNASKNNSLCSLPVFGDEPIARCMELIKPSEAIEAIESFIFGGCATY